MLQYSRVGGLLKLIYSGLTMVVSANNWQRGSRTNDNQHRHYHSFSSSFRCVLQKKNIDRTHAYVWYWFSQRIVARQWELKLAVKRSVLGVLEYFSFKMLRKSLQNGKLITCKLFLINEALFIICMVWANIYSNKSFPNGLFPYVYIL